MDNKLEIILAAKNHTDKTFAQVQKRLGALSKSVFSFNGAIVTLAGGAGIGMLANGFLSTARSFEKFEIQLETITGSSVKAKKSMDWIADFTKNTPYELARVTEGFVKLEAYGLSGTRWMGTLGDTAASMGRGINEAVEMFADAVTGEFERLKGFGVKASTQGDKVTFKWSQNGKDMVLSADKTQSGISDALEKIFSRFKGGSAKLSKTLDGMFSNISDQWVDLQKTVMDAGMFKEIKTQVGYVGKEFKDWVETNDDLIKQNIPVYISNTKEAISETYDTLKNVKSFYDSIPDEIKGSAGIGLVGAALFGAPGALIFATIAGVNREIRDLKTGMDGFREGKLSWRESLGGALPISNIPLGGNKDALKNYRKQQKELKRELLKNIGTNGLHVTNTETGSHSNLGQLQQIIEYSKKAEKAVVKVRKAFEFKTTTQAYDGRILKAKEQVSRVKILLEEKAELEKQFAEEKKQREIQFADDYNRTTTSTFEFEKFNLKQQYNYYSGYVKDKQKLDEWYAKELQKVTEQNVEVNKSAIQGYSDNIGTVMESLDRAGANAFKTMEDSLVGFVMTGKFEFKDFARSIIADLARIAIQQTVMKGVTNWVGGLFTTSAQGNVFGSTGLTAYAQGGSFTNKVVSKPTFFAHGGGFGVMGEAGDEAIIPLTRMSGGDLGVKSKGGSGAPNIQINVINKTGNETRARQEQPKWDGEKWVIGVVLDALERNKGGFANNMKAAMQN